MHNSADLQVVSFLHQAVSSVPARWSTSFMHGEQDGFVPRSGLTLMIIALMGIGLFYFEGFTILEIQNKCRLGQCLLCVP